MFAKPVGELIYDDIFDLVNTRQEREGYKLDFKREIGNPDKAKKELSKDISAFANSTGGYLIIGVDKQYNITGIDTTIQNKPVDEWLNQVLSSNIEPQLFYHDPRVISIPESDKVIVVIHVPESSKKPHIVTEWNLYHLRVNDSNKTANHGQIRDMFEFSKNRTNELDAFLQKKNLFDEESPDFGMNRNSRELLSNIPDDHGFARPHLLYSFIPKYPSTVKLNMSMEDFKTWLNSNTAGYAPLPGSSIFRIGYNDDTTLHGIVLKNVFDKKLRSYVEILDNGYIEVGASSSFTFGYKDRSERKMVALHPTYIVGFQMQLMGFAKRYYQLIKYYDEVILQISFVNMERLKLWGFNGHYNSMTHYEMGEIWNKHHPNFKLIQNFNPATLTDEGILTIAKDTAEKICRAFGLDKDYCFVDDKLNLNDFSRFSL